MRVDRPSADARVSAEASAAANLDEVCRWLFENQSKPLRLEVGDLPALGQVTRLRLAIPMTAPRAVLCALWLLEDVDAGACLLAGQLRFVAHPTGSEIKLSFTGRTAPRVGSDLLRQSQHAAGQLVQVIADSIQRSAGLTRRRPAPI